MRPSPEASRRPSGLHSTESTALTISLAGASPKVRINSPVVTSNSLTCPSPLRPLLIEASLRVSGLKERLNIEPFSKRTSRPVAASHKLTLRSPLPAAIQLPFGLHATLKTGGAVPAVVSCLQRLTSRPVAASHHLTVPSLPPEASMRPSGLHATDFTAAMCPIKVRRSRPVVTSHTFTVQSRLAVASHRPSGLNTAR